MENLKAIKEYQDAQTLLTNAMTVLKDFNKPFSRGGVGVEVLEVFWEELWLHFFWPTFWLHCILYRTYTWGEAPPIRKIQNAM